MVEVESEEVKWNILKRRRVLARSKFLRGVFLCQDLSRDGRQWMKVEREERRQKRMQELRERKEEETAGKRTRVSETRREMCGVGEDWIHDMTKEKMNERVMEAGKEKWKRFPHRTDLTRKYAVEKEAVMLESYADGSLGARVRMLLRGDCLPIRTNSCIHWRYREEERDCVCGERQRSMCCWTAFVLAQATNKWWNSPVIKGLKYYDLT
ncbi:hypothetical protein CAPTEDRAFT_208041 [Capitella teleta]|uniref:Uncharacterized protein n=1 Tax=Capitella teleta TaxID=283909 RepID=R7U0L2_CAPTE|nr:hypothetical protein CAPTEDRAFT_208041 [Capitella teleta]|eukprot:ELT99382.1 hypothetical protein CAPTEDRAFT_208041 [Capitella teleta]